MKKGVLGASFISVLLFAFQATAVTTVVKSIKRTRGDFYNIQVAINSIPDDLVAKDESWILEIQDDGLYAEPLLLEKKTDASHTITIRSANLNLHPSIVTQYSHDGLRILHTPYVTIDGLRFMGYSSNVAPGIEIVSSDYVTIQNCDILGLPLGIHVVDSNFSLLTHNDVHSCNRGIHLESDSSNNLIERNKLYHNIHSGLDLESNASDNRIRSNIFFNNTYSLYISKAGSGNSFTDNIIEAGNMSQYLIYAKDSLADNLKSNFNTLHVAKAKMGYIEKTSYKDLSNWNEVGLDQDSSAQNPHLEDFNADLVVTQVVKTVGKTGAEFSTISQALNSIPKNLIASNQSWILEIQDSATYPEKINISEFQTSPNHTLTIRAKDGETPIIQNIAWDDSFKLVSVKYITLSGLTIDANKTTRGIVLWGSRYCIIKKCHIFNALASGIVAIASPANIISGNKIHHCQRCIELLQNSTHNSIKDNDIYRSVRGTGIYLASGTAFNYIDGNILFNHNEAIVLHSDVGTDNKFTHNIIVHSLSDRHVAIYINGNIPEGTFFDCNDIFMPEGFVAQVHGSYYRTLKDWQSKGVDLHSFSTDPHFTSTVDGQEDFTIPPDPVPTQPINESSSNGTDNQTSPNKDPDPTPPQHSDSSSSKEQALHKLFTRRDQKKDK